jgi:DNA-binding CsgD family transcriptional regulator
VLQWRGDYIEALVRAGQVGEAAAEIEAFASQAERVGRAWPAGAVARCRGLLAGDDEIDAWFGVALEAGARGGEFLCDPFERARTELAFGERLRRARRAVDAREPLRAALEVFERLGAEPWARRARSELRATGAAVGPQRDPLARQLTAQELQVALLVAQGMTNREVAAALFLSPKTIEAHLGRIFRKLDVRSRTQLAAMVASEAPRSTTG